MIECIKRVDPHKDIKLGNSTINFMRNSNNDYIPEDVFFSKSMIDFDIGKVARRDIANRFSQETQNCKETVGGHNFWLARNGKTFYTLTKLRIKEREITNSRDHGLGKNYGMQLLNYQTNNVLL